MDWLAIVKLLALAMKFIADKQLIDAGISKNVAANATDTLAAINRAVLARNSVRDDANSVRDDPDNTDSKPK